MMMIVDRIVSKSKKFGRKLLMGLIEKNKKVLKL